MIPQGGDILISALFARKGEFAGFLQEGNGRCLHCGVKNGTLFIILEMMRGGVALLLTIEKGGIVC